VAAHSFCPAAGDKTDVDISIDNMMSVLLAQTRLQTKKQKGGGDREEEKKLEIKDEKNQRK
jgi:hypothetical protein